MRKARQSMTRAPVKRPFIGVRTPLAEFTAALVKTNKYSLCLCCWGWNVHLERECVTGIACNWLKIQILIKVINFFCILYFWPGRRIQECLSSRLPASLGSHPLACPPLSIGFDVRIIHTFSFILILIIISFTKSFCNGGGINDGNDRHNDQRQAKSEGKCNLEGVNDNSGDVGLFLWCRCWEPANHPPQRDRLLFNSHLAPISRQWAPKLRQLKSW